MGLYEKKNGKYVKTAGGGTGSGGSGEPGADSQKVDKDQGAANAGKLLYVGTDGLVAPLTLGNGLQIVNGVLTITGQPSTPEETAIAFLDNGDGSATVQGVTFEDQGNGVVLMRGYKNSEVTA